MTDRVSEKGKIFILKCYHKIYPILSYILEQMDVGLFYPKHNSINRLENIFEYSSSI